MKEIFIIEYELIGKFALKLKFSPNNYKVYLSIPKRSIKLKNNIV
jgi:hypothetical protein